MTIALNTFLALLINFSFLKAIHSCFVVHYVLYFSDMPMKYYLQISQNSSFPYIVHLNQPLNLPNKHQFTRQITPVQMSDIKKVQIIYHHGGLYLDNDQFIDYKCVKRHICNLTGLYFLDWTFKQRWIQSVPLSFIYSSHPGNKTLLRSLEGLNQSATGDKGPATVYFSGPAHMQQYRDGMSFVKIPKRCQFHRADRSWIDNKPPNQLSYQRRVEKQVLQSFSNQQKQGKQKYLKLWNTHTVIYPKNFNTNIQARMDETYNHVEMLDKVKVQIRQTKQLLEQFLTEMNISLVSKQQGDKVKTQQKHQNKKIQIEIKKSVNESFKNQQGQQNKTIQISKIKNIDLINDSKIQIQKQKALVSSQIIKQQKDEPQTLLSFHYNIYFIVIALSLVVLAIFMYRIRLSLCKKNQNKTNKHSIENIRLSEQDKFDNIGRNQLNECIQLQNNNGDMIQIDGTKNQESCLSQNKVSNQNLVEQIGNKSNI